MVSVLFLGIMGCIPLTVQVSSPNSETDVDQRLDTADSVNTDDEDTASQDTQDTDTENTEMDTDDQETNVEDIDGDGVVASEDCDDNDPSVGTICNLCIDGEIEPYNGGTYIFCPHAETMTDAFLSCVEMGATPVKIDNEAENSWLYNTALTKPIYDSYNNGEHRTIGLTRINSFPTWEWYDGTQIGSYFPANTGYNENSDSDRSCSMMIINATDSAAVEAEWHGKVCSESYAYICEM